MLFIFHSSCRLQNFFILLCSMLKLRDWSSCLNHSCSLQVPSSWVWPTVDAGGKLKKQRHFFSPHSPSFRLRIRAFLHDYGFPNVSSTPPSQGFLTLRTVFSTFLPLVPRALMASRCCFFPGCLIISRLFHNPSHISLSSPFIEVFLFEPFEINSVSFGDPE